MNTMEIMESEEFLKSLNREEITTIIEESYEKGIITYKQKIEILKIGAFELNQRHPLKFGGEISTDVK